MKLVGSTYYIGSTLYELVGSILYEISRFNIIWN